MPRDSPSPVPRIELSGTSYEIGEQHGRLLRAQIHSQLALYRTLFREKSGCSWPEVRARAALFRPALARAAPHLLVEMQGIADGASAGGGGAWDSDGGGGDGSGGGAWGTVDATDVLALNARSELALGAWSDGCTSVAWALPRRQVLAQNWDWRTGVGANLALARIAQAGKPTIWMVIEPGIVGKIGFNAASVGVCLNALRAAPTVPAQLPIHVFLRLALECPSAAAARALFAALGGPASAQHILLADAAGAHGLELSPVGGARVAPDAGGLLVHTNHLLLPPPRGLAERPWLSGSPARLARARALCAELRAAEGADVGGPAAPRLLRERVFADTRGAPQAICCSMDEGDDDESIATLFNIVMVFEEGQEPRAEVLFGKPGPANQGPVVVMPW